MCTVLVKASVCPCHGELSRRETICGPGRNRGLDSPGNSPCLIPSGFILQPESEADVNQLIFIQDP